MDGSQAVAAAVAAASGPVAATVSAASRAMHGAAPPRRRATLVHRVASRRPRSRLRTLNFPCCTTHRIGVADRFSIQSVS